jgi:hypothetical protein
MNVGASIARDEIGTRESGSPPGRRPRIRHRFAIRANRAADDQELVPTELQFHWIPIGSSE